MASRATAVAQEPVAAAEGPDELRRSPMYVMPVAKLMELTRLPTHEEAMAGSMLTEWQEGMAPVLFVSQTWLGYAHPDDAVNSKCVLLKGLLQRATEGRLTIVPNWVSQLAYGRGARSVSAAQLKQDLRHGFVWFDIFSVPQVDKEQQALAIASIASFVGSCSHFLCLAGPWEHEDGSIRDVRAWSGRGWCRVELLANALSPTRTKPLIIAQSLSDVQSHGPGGMQGRDWIFNVVGDGAFTVDADRPKLVPALSELIERRKHKAKLAGTAKELLLFRVLHACKAHLLSKLDTEPLLCPSVDEWLSELGFSSVRDGMASGWTPLRFAIMAGHTKLAEELLDKGADVTSPLKRGDNRFAAQPGQTLLHLACFIRDDPDMVRLLLSRGADPRRPDKSSVGGRPLALACAYGGRRANVDVMIAHDPSLTRLQDPRTGLLPLSMAPFYGHAAIVEHLLTHYPKLVDKHMPIGPGQTAGWCTVAMMMIGDVDTLRVLLDHGFPYDNVARQTRFQGRLMMGVADMVLRLFRRPSMIFLCHAFSMRCTALHAAAFNGNLGGVKMLLEKGHADPASTNQSHKMTPLHLAALGGHQQVVDLLIAAGAPVGARDCTKRTAAAWAARMGHTELARRLDSVH